MIFETEETKLKAAGQALARELAAAAEQRDLLTGRLEYLEGQRKNLLYLVQTDSKSKTLLNQVSTDRDDITRQIAEVDQKTAALNDQAQAVTKALREIEQARIKDDYRLTELDFCLANKRVIDLYKQTEAARDQANQKHAPLLLQVERMKAAGLSIPGGGFTLPSGSDELKLAWLAARIKELS